MSALSAFVPDWDQSRVSSGRDYTYQDESILIATDFECGSSEEIFKVGDDSFQMGCEPEPGTEHRFAGKATYFCVGLHNKRKTPRRIRLTVLNLTHDLKETRHVTVRQGADHWSHLPHRDVTPNTDRKELRLDVDLPPFSGMDSVIFLCNFHWYPYTDMRRYLMKVAEQYPFASLENLGKTHQGREILAINFGDPVGDKPRILVTQTTQPSESGHWSCKSVIDFLISDDPEAEKVRERNFISIIPHTNPDGTVLGHGMTNALGQAPFFDGYAASEGQEAPLESLFLWNHLKDLKPWLFIEFHSAFQDYRKKHAVFKFDQSLASDPEVRNLIARCDELLDAMPENFTESVTDRQRGYTMSLAYAAATKLNVVSYMYKLHDKFPLKDNLAQALRVFRTLEGACRGEALLRSY